MDDTLHHALHCQPSTSTQPQHHNHPQLPQMSRDADSPVSPSGSNASKNTTTTASSASPLPSSGGGGVAPLKQIFPIRSPSLNTTSNTSNSVKKLFSKTEAPLSARAHILTSSHVQLPPQQRLVQVHSLTKELLAISVEQKCQVWDIYHCCCSHLGIDDPRMLGLAIRAPSEGIGSDRPRHEYFFLQNDQKVAKYLPKQSRFSKTSSNDKNRPVLVLYLRVRVFVERIDMIQCPVALHHYYLQLRENLLDQWSGSNSVREERCWELATLAVQADEAEHGTPSQFRAEKYFPLWVINLRGLEYVRKNMPKIVRNPEFKVSSVREAKMQFCQEASRSPFALNCHLYGLRRHKADMTDNALIGINDKGIDMWDVGRDGERIPLRSLPWNKMVRLTFDHKKLTIGGVDNSKMSLYAQSDDKARYLLNFCKDVHQQLIQINLHFALNKKPYNSLPPGWGNEVCVDNARINRLAALPPLQSPSPLSQSASTTPAQASPASAIIPPIPARGNSPHPLMRIHTQHSIDSTTTEAMESEKTSVKDRTGSDASAATNTTSELPKKKRSSGGAKARIGNTNLPPQVNTKIGRYEPHQPKHNRVSPTYSNESGQVSLGAAEPATSISNELETFLNNAASPPRYKLSEEELPNGIMTNSTSSAMSVLSQKLNGNISNGMQQHFDASGYSNGAPMDPTAERRSHFVASRTFDDYSTSAGNQAVIEAASRSMHDLHAFGHQPPLRGGTPMQNIRQPPNYHAALQQLNQHQQHRPYPPPGAMPPPPPHMGPRPSRWPTVNGTDPDIMALIERMQLQHQQLVPSNVHPPIPRKQNSMTIEQQQEQFAVHRGVSEPRLNLSVHQNNQQPQVASQYANIPIPHQQQQNMEARNVAQKKRRYTSRSPSSRGINRVKSMPAPSALLMNEAQASRMGQDEVNGVRSGGHYARQPPPYDHALQMQRETNVSRKNALEKRHSTSGIALEHVNKYPMLSMLMQENGGMPSTSASEDTSSTSVMSTAQAVMPPRDYDRSSMESDTVSVESYRQQQHHRNDQQSDSFNERYAATPPRNIKMIQQASSASGSPPSPPFYYSNGQGPIMWNNNPANGFSRGEYLFSDHIPSFLAAATSGPNGYRNINPGDLGLRPNGLYQSQGVVDLPNPPPYPQGSLVM